MPGLEHVCDERTIDYTTINRNFIRCTVCPRRWVFNSYRGWIMQPQTPKPDRHEPDYWFSRTEPQPVLTQEQIIARRERRLEMLARKEKERADALSETDQAWKRLQKRTGAKRFDLKEAQAKLKDRQPEKKFVIPLTHKSVFRKL